MPSRPFHFSIAQSAECQTGESAFKCSGLRCLWSPTSTTQLQCRNIRFSRGFGQSFFDFRLDIGVFVLRQQHIGVGPQADFVVFERSVAEFAACDLPNQRIDFRLCGTHVQKFAPRYFFLRRDSTRRRRTATSNRVARPWGFCLDRVFHGEQSHRAEFRLLIALDFFECLEKIFFADIETCRNDERGIAGYPVRVWMKCSDGPKGYDRQFHRVSDGPGNFSRLGKRTVAVFYFVLFIAVGVLVVLRLFETSLGSLGITPDNRGMLFCLFFSSANRSFTCLSKSS